MTQAPAYWDDVASTATFTHPVNVSWISAHCNTSRPALDFGCGYGRVLGELREIGFSQLVGVDPSGAMIDRARAEHPGGDFAVIEGTRTPFPASVFGLVTLVAVLTCVPDPAEQRAIIDEILRLLEPKGCLYVSDFLLQDNRRNLERYVHFNRLGFDYGTFEIDDGRTVMRHHERSYLDSLLSGFDTLEQDSFELRTMKGNEAVGIRLLLRKR